MTTEELENLRAELSKAHSEIACRNEMRYKIACLQAALTAETENANTYAHERDRYRAALQKISDTTELARLRAEVEAMHGEATARATRERQLDREHKHALLAEKESILGWMEVMGGADLVRAFHEDEKRRLAK